MTSRDTYELCKEMVNLASTCQLVRDCQALLLDRLRLQGFAVISVRKNEIQTSPPDYFVSTRSLVQDDASGLKINIHTRLKLRGTIEEWGELFVDWQAVTSTSTKYPESSQEQLASKAMSYQPAFTGAASFDALREMYTNRIQELSAWTASEAGRAQADLFCEQVSLALVP